MTKELTRRQFLQIGAAGAAGLVLADGLWRMVRAAGDEEWAPTLARMGEPIPTTCAMCPAGCGLLGYLDGDELTGIFGHPDHPVNHGRICARGLAGLNILYDPDRLLYPLKRTGKRGEGKWKRMSWDEAYEALSSRISLLMRQGRSEAIGFDVDREEPVVKRFLDALGEPAVIDRSLTTNLNQRTARLLSCGCDEIRINPLKSTYILMFGANPLEHDESYMSFVRALIQARVDGQMKLVIFDARHSNTAAGSDESFLIRPGTDGLMALAMANVILKEKWHDQDFMRNCTNYPIEPLVEHLSPYTVEKAEAVSGVGGADIRRIARELATNKPAVALSGGGVSGHRQGLQNERAVMLLNAVTGNMNVEGGLSARIRPSLPEPGPYQPHRRHNWDVGRQPAALPDLWEGGRRIDLLVTCRSNPAYDDPEPARTRTILEDEARLPLFISLETHMTETAAMADMVLPLATFLESWDLHHCLSLEGESYLSLQQPVIKRQAETKFLKAGSRISSPPFKPLGEAASSGEVCIEVAGRIGGDVAAMFPCHSTREFVEQMSAPLEETEQEGIGYLKKRGFLRWAGTANGRGALAQGDFQTPSGKYEIYSEVLARMGHDPLPTWTGEPRRDPDDGHFTLVTFRPHLHTERTANCKWLAEMAHNHPVWIHAGRARRLGIEEGQEVRISSSIGTVTARVHVTDCIHEEALAMARGFGHWGWGHIARAEKAESPDPDTQLVWWGKNGNGVHPGLLVPYEHSLAGGGQVWQGIEVEVTRI